MCTLPLDSTASQLATHAWLSQRALLPPSEPSMTRPSDSPKRKVCPSLPKLRFLQEWATPLTMVNFVLLGCASGFTLAATCAAWLAPSLVRALAVCACALTLCGCATRVASLVRNARLRPKSTVQSATGITSPKLVQKSRGFTAGAFNLREFFHGQTQRTLRHVKWAFLVAAFVVPFVRKPSNNDAGQRVMERSEELNVVQRACSRASARRNHRRSEREEGAGTAR